MPFYVAHVARTHRWLQHVTHFAPNRQEFWQSHVAVATSGFVDAFAVVSKDVDIDLKIDTELDNAAREKLIANIACDEVLLCAGRSDGWMVTNIC